MCVCVCWTADWQDHIRAWCSHWMNAIRCLLAGKRQDITHIFMHSRLWRLCEAGGDLWNYKFYFKTERHVEFLWRSCLVKPLTSPICCIWLPVRFALNPLTSRQLRLHVDSWLDKVSRDTREPRVTEQTLYICDYCQDKELFTLNLIRMYRLQQLWFKSDV